jgi:hypothetical protein
MVRGEEKAHFAKRKFHAGDPAPPWMKDQERPKAVGGFE